MTLKKKKPRKKKCRAPECQNWFTPYRSLVKWCSPECGVIIAQQARVKKERKELRERKQAVKTRAEWLREAQAEFNRYIRLRDQRLPCISCGNPLRRAGRGGRGDKGFDAGHYRTVGACSALRFDEENVHGQCVACNQHKSGNIVEYRINLRQRIGDVELERLESTNPLRAWTIEEAKYIKAKYKEKIKQVKESMDAQ